MKNKQYFDIRNFICQLICYPLNKRDLTLGQSGAQSAITFLTDRIKQMLYQNSLR